MAQDLTGRLTELADSVVPGPPDLVAARRRARAVTTRRRLSAAGLVAAGLLGVAVLPGVLVEERLEQRFTTPTPQRSATPAPTAVAARALPAERLVQLDGDRFGAASADLVAEPPLRVAKDLRRDADPSEEEFASVAAVFDTSAIDPDCLDRAVLQLRLRPDPAGPGGEIAAYASAARSLADGRVPPPGSGGPATLLDNRPRGTASFAPGDDLLELDVTEVARLWVAGDAFPSRGRRVPVGSPLVLLVRPPDASDGTYGVGLLGADLVLTPSPGC